MLINNELLSGIEILTKIQNQIPEFDAKQIDGGWVWTYRCTESEKFDTLIDCFIDFAATMANDADELMGLGQDDDIDSEQASQRLAKHAGVTP